MMENRRIIQITLVIALIAILVLAAYYTVKLNTQTIGSELIKEEPQAYHEGSRYRDYISEDLGIRFSYPASWGELTEWILETPEDLQGYRSEATISTNKTPFISFVTTGDAPNRDGWWGDIAIEAIDQRSILLFCDTYSDRSEYYIQPKEACEILTNENGVTFARLGGDTSWFGWETEETYVYIAFHPNHPYYGVVLSAQGLRRAGLEAGIGNTEKAIQEIANSLSFIE